MKTSTAPAATPGRLSGKMTWRKVLAAPAPRLCAAQSSSTGMALSEL